MTDFEIFKVKILFSNIFNYLKFRSAANPNIYTSFWKPNKFPNYSQAR